MIDSRRANMASAGWTMKFSEETTGFSFGSIASIGAMGNCGPGRWCEDGMRDDEFARIQSKFQYDDSKQTYIAYTTDIDWEGISSVAEFALRWLVRRPVAFMEALGADFSGPRSDCEMNGRCKSKGGQTEAQSLPGGNGGPSVPGESGVGRNADRILRERARRQQEAERRRNAAPSGRRCTGGERKCPNPGQWKHPDTGKPTCDDCMPSGRGGYEPL